MYKKNCFLHSLGDRFSGRFDIILVTGDAYIDHHSFGVSLIGKLLKSKGYSVAVIGQPDINSDKDICYFGEPKLFWGVTGGSVDSMTANYTSSGKKRKSDDYTPGGINNKRPDRAVIVFSNLIRRYFKKQRIVLGGLEASLRRLCHYDSRANNLKRSILADSKADWLIYGMGENSVVELARCLKENQIEKIKDIRGLCYKTGVLSEGVFETLSYEEILKSKKNFLSFFKMFYENTDPAMARPLAQKAGNSYVVQNPPAFFLTTPQLDEIYKLDFAADVHPYYKKLGSVKAAQTVKFSITSHRGCFGNCRFCSLTAHQGRKVISRSKESILKEARALSLHPDFKGVITDVGGPTANMYMAGCRAPNKTGACADKECLTPAPCPNLLLNHKKYIELLEAVKKLDNVRKVFVSSGIRYDMILADKNRKYILKKLLTDFISGQMKIAPEHFDDYVLKLMNKPSFSVFKDFLNLFDECAVKNMFFVCYFIAGYPGASVKNDMNLKKLIKSYLKFTPLQVQLFTPTPSTWATAMYYCGLDEKGEKIHAETGEKERNLRKKLFVKN